jgi:hypothetical protein
MQHIFFLDTEFINTRWHPELISLGLCDLQGTIEYEATSSEFDPSRACAWVQKNILPTLPPERKSHGEIRRDLEKIFSDGIEQVWTYGGSIDYLLVTYLFADDVAFLPRGFPHYSLDLRQMLLLNGIRTEELPPKPAAEHTPLADARWNREVYRFLLQRKLIDPEREYPKMGLA